MITPWCFRNGCVYAPDDRLPTSIAEVVPSRCKFMMKVNVIGGKLSTFFNSFLCMIDIFWQRERPSYHRNFSTFDIHTKFPGWVGRIKILRANNFIFLRAFGGQIEVLCHSMRYWGLYHLEQLDMEVWWWGESGVTTGLVRILREGWGKCSRMRIYIYIFGANTVRMYSCFFQLWDIHWEDDHS